MGGLKEDLAYDPPCHPRAEQKCQSQINALYECCNAFYETRGEDAKTPSCPKYSLLKLRMKQRAESN
ncbi:DUF1903-domain-containing protein [Aspergillus avenaceus]|uniref:Cx9C motif-containing protein 4, mitochondrial n=1 Tax=Aspergillus avenaceus TaxID=36643 RepID=A0A5N6THG1_ASPAV|nr:DUF1903-domain-containing protein [Aspergillus avenaceus]